ILPKNLNLNGFLDGERMACQPVGTPLEPEDGLLGGEKEARPDGWAERSTHAHRNDKIPVHVTQETGSGHAMLPARDGDGQPVAFAVEPAVAHRVHRPVPARGPRPGSSGPWKWGRSGEQATGGAGQGTEQQGGEAMHGDLL